MLHYERIDVSEGIDVNTTSASNEIIICHYWYFLDKGFKFQASVRNGCPDVLMMSTNLNSIAILNIHDVDYRCVIIILLELSKVKPLIYIRKWWFQ